MPPRKRRNAPVAPPAAAAEEEDEADEEEEEAAAADADADEEEEDENGMVRAAVRRAFDKELLAAKVPAPLAAALRAGLSFPLCDASGDGDGGIRTLTLVSRLAAGGPGAELRLFSHQRARFSSLEFALALHWRPLPAPARPAHGRRRGADGGDDLEAKGWKRLAAAHLEDPPRTGNAECDDACSRQYEVNWARGLTPAAVAGLRAAVLGKGAAAPDKAALPDIVLLRLAMLSCAALDTELELGLGHVWYPAKDLCKAPLRAEPTSWLEHAARLAARAPESWDVYYEGVDMDEVKKHWAEQVLEWRCMQEEDDEFDDDEDEEVEDPMKETLPPADELWDYAVERGGLPWRRGGGGGFALGGFHSQLLAAMLRR